MIMFMEGPELTMLSVSAGMQGREECQPWQRICRFVWGRREADFVNLPYCLAHETHCSPVARMYPWLR